MLVTRNAPTSDDNKGDNEIDHQFLLFYVEYTRIEREGDDVKYIRLFISIALRAGEKKNRDEGRVFSGFG